MKKAYCSFHQSITANLFINGLIFCWLTFGSLSTLAQPSVNLKVIEVSKTLIDENTPGMKNVKYGNEGGDVIKDSKGVYHWFTSEQFGDPYWVANAITQWTSSDGLKWVKDTTWKKEGNHDFTNSKPKASYFDPTVVYDNRTGYWYMFYVAYHCVSDSIYDVLFKKAKPTSLYNGGINNRAQIYRSKAIKPGLDGLGGPYHDNDSDDVIVIEPIDNPQPYEAQWVGDTKFGYGCATVTPYRVNKEWVILYAENMLAKSKTLTGKFERLPEGKESPVTYQRPLMRWVADSSHKFYIENPIIYQIPKGATGAGTYIMIVGMYIDHTIRVFDTSYGYATSQDGIHWSAVEPLSERFGDCITACSFIPEGNDEYSIYVTGRDKNYERFKRILVKLTIR